MTNTNKPTNDGIGGDSSESKGIDDVKPADYLRAVKAHLRSGKQKEAFRVLQQASVMYPDDPVILSYYGCLQALVDKKYRSGVDTCKKAIVLLKKKRSSGEEVLYPVFYLNLGRAYVAAGKRKEAIEAFEKGLQYDYGNNDLKKELRSMGTRKRPLVPFLDRSNPINKYIGMILHPTKKDSREGERTKTRRTGSYR
jgi:tetratricopeptide (TPR) repeat protein